MPFKSIGIEIEDKIFQRAKDQAKLDGKTLNRVMLEALYAYIGETPPPLPKPDTPSTPTPVIDAPKSTIYVVQSGDTLGAIAKKVYGSATKYYIIQKSNNLSDPGKIWVGQKLVIPALDPNTGQPVEVVTTPTPAPTPTPPPAHSGGSGGDSEENSTTLKNPRPANIEFVGSPNFNARPHGEISAIVMHATANDNLQRVIEWFNNPDAQVSAHYTIGKDGTIVQHVRDEHRAWHAGRSEWKGRADLNSWAIGVEMVNWNNGEDPFPEAQYQAGFNLVSYLCEKYSIDPDLIVAHYDVSPHRKTDPKGYDMNRLRAEVKKRLQ